MESHILTDSLSGPDMPAQPIPAPVKSPVIHVPAGVQPSVTIYTDALSGTVDKTTGPAGGAGSSPGAATYTGTGMPGVGPGGVGGGRHTTGGSGPLPTPVVVVDAIPATPCPLQSPEFYFCGSMSEELLHRYLDRAIEMVRVSFYWEGNLAYSRVPCTSANQYDEIRMITDVGAKFVGGMLHFWNEWGSISTGLAQLKIDIDAIHNTSLGGDPDVICEARVFAYIDSGILSVAIPDYVCDLFGRARGSTFNYWGMLYDGGISPTYGYFSWANALDISKLESQMWVYYLATSFIEHGAEAVYLGDAGSMNYIDGAQGNKSYYYVANLIREYARNPPAGKNGARRKLVLLSAGVIAGPVSGLGIYGSIYYDPPTSLSDPTLFIKPAWERQLIWDYHFTGTQVVSQPDFSVACSMGEFYPVVLNPESSWWADVTPAGKHPLGWYCAHIACIVDNDNGAGLITASGCGYYYYQYGTEDRSAIPFWDPFWGFDPSTWFLFISSDWRDKFIPYFYYGIKCISPYMHNYLPGRILSSDFDMTGEIEHYIYTANNYPQKSVIQGLWSGIYTSPTDWVQHNFISENVSDPYYDGVPTSDMIFIGTDKIYYIGYDGYIHGLIKVNGDYNDGTWLTVSPSYATSVPISLQVKARSDLVASPDGTRLLYIGENGFIYGFDIVNAWTYNYLAIHSTDYSIGTVILLGGFMRDALTAQNIRAVSSLIYTDNGIFYVGKYLGDGSQYVHGFVYDSGDWHTVSPSYSAVATNPIHITDEAQALGALVYDSNAVPNRLFYKGMDGLLYYFLVYDIWTYYYIECSRSYQLRALRCTIQGNLALHYYPSADTTIIYFIANSAWDGSLRLCCVQQTGSDDWILLTDVWDGTGDYFSLIQSDTEGNVAVSPDGTIIAYIGREPDNVVVYFEYINNLTFSYHLMQVNDSVGLSNSLQFTGDSDLFFISPLSGSLIQHMKYQEAYCKNTIFGEYPGS